MSENIASVQAGDAVASRQRADAAAGGTTPPGVGLQLRGWATQISGTALLLLGAGVWVSLLPLSAEGTFPDDVNIVTWLLALAAVFVFGFVVAFTGIIMIGVGRAQAKKQTGTSLPVKHHLSGRRKGVGLTVILISFVFFMASLIFAFVM